MSEESTAWRTSSKVTFRDLSFRHCSWEYLVRGDQSEQNREARLPRLRHLRSLGHSTSGLPFRLRVAKAGSWPWISTSGGEVMSHGAVEKSLATAVNNRRRQIHMHSDAGDSTVTCISRRHVERVSPEVAEASHTVTLWSAWGPKVCQGNHKNLKRLHRTQNKSNCSIET